MSCLESVRAGKILYFPKLGFAVDDNWRCLFSSAIAHSRAKNISLNPKTGVVSGTIAPLPQQAELKAMMENFGTTATRFARDLLPCYATSLERARASFRPVQIADRKYSLRQDDRLLHIDAFPSTPTQGRRILRLFSNVNPLGVPRVWRIGEPFAAFAEKFLPSLGQPAARRAWLLAAVGITKGRRTAYDQLMLHLHDVAKRDVVYQREGSQTEIAFLAGTSWLCFSDQVVHAILSGQYALEQTFYVDIASMGEPANSPVRTLERLTGRKLC
jgi:hypothetical protein